MPVSSGFIAYPNDGIANVVRLNIEPNCTTATCNTTGCRLPPDLRKKRFSHPVFLLASYTNQFQCLSIEQKVKNPEAKENCNTSTEDELTKLLDLTQNRSRTPKLSDVPILE